MIEAGVRLSFYDFFSRTVLREIKKKGITNILVDTDPRNMDHFFRVILQLQMNNPAFHFTFTSLDVESFDLEDFRYNRVNMTAFRLVDSTSERVRSLLREMEEISPIGRAILNQSQVSLGPKDYAGMMPTEMGCLPKVCPMERRLREFGTDKREGVNYPKI